MIPVSLSKAAVFHVERLEDRCVLTGLPWPIPFESINGIMTTYGQFENRRNIGSGGIHFHEGLDILVAQSTTVKAIESGLVVKIKRDPDPNTTDPDKLYNSWVSVRSSNSSGWNYVHVIPDKGLEEGVTRAYCTSGVDVTPSS